MAPRPAPVLESPHGPVAAAADSGGLQRSWLGVFTYSRPRACSWCGTTNKALSITLAILTLAAGVLPAGVAFVGAQIVDAVIHAADVHRQTGTGQFAHVMKFVALEAALIAAMSMAQRGISLAQSLLRAQLGQRVNVMILEKALTLELDANSKDSEFLRQADARAPRSVQPVP